jgi:hypothetical protein
MVHLRKLFLVAQSQDSAKYDQFVVHLDAADTIISVFSKS